MHPKFIIISFLGLWGPRTEPNFERKIVGNFSKKIPNIGAHNLLMKNVSISILIFLYEPSNPYLSLGKNNSKKMCQEHAQIWL